MTSKMNFCNNCGKSGHAFHRCQKPITSLGIIVIKKETKQSNKNKDIHKYLMICRKDSFGYIEFLRGKYPMYNREYIQNIINEMTIQEKSMLLNDDFDTLWAKLWGGYNNYSYKNEEINAREKFNEIKRGVHLYNEEFYDLKVLINNSNTSWVEPEWGFPKGRRNYHEKDLTAALREFEEETGISKYNLSIINNVIPYDEIFIGSNIKSYKHKYFLAILKRDIPINNFQRSEVSNMMWFKKNDALRKLRPYNYERIKIINNIEKSLNKYSLIS
jgi:8-oxo-dGTP pyrophosphatase MutT (NUDIX family)